MRWAALVCAGLLGLVVAATAPAGEGAPGPAEPSAPAPADSRLLWQIATRGGTDRFAEILPVGDTLLTMRRGVLYALKASSGKVLWRFPQKGRASEEADWPTCFMLGVLGDQLITRLPHPDGRQDAGLQAIGLADGELKHQIKIGKDVPSLRGERASVGSFSRASLRMAMWNQDYEKRVCEVSVVDLEKWVELVRFQLPTVAGDKLVVSGTSVSGTLSAGDEQGLRSFTLDWERGEMCTLPLRGGWNVWPTQHRFFADGGRLVPEGRVSAKCAYERPWPRAWAATVLEGLVFAPDRRGLYRADPADGHELWRLDLGTHPDLGNRHYQVAVGGGLAAVLTETRIYVLDAASGKLRAAIRALPQMRLEGLRTDDAIVQCDQDRVYYAWVHGLKVFSARAVDPAKADPHDSGDPAWLLARSREALVKGNYGGALEVIRGLSAAIGLRPAQRAEAAALLSQLSRSPAAELFPELWHQVMLCEGPLAGELFVADYERLAAQSPEAVSALISVGTDRALTSASKLALGHQGFGHTVAMAAEAVRIRTGSRPLDEVAAMPGLNAWPVLEVLLDNPLDDAAFARLLPRLRQCVLGQGAWLHFLHNLQPRQALNLLQGQSVEPKLPETEYARRRRRELSIYVEACKQQAESQQKGEGRQEPVKITKPTDKPAVEEF